MPALYKGPIGQPILTFDDDGYRNYAITFQVSVDDVQDGPKTALSAVGLPVIGDTYAYGNDIDVWVWRKPAVKVAPVVDKNDLSTEYLVTCDFTNKPLTRKCITQSIDDPLLQPQRISGGFVKRQLEAVFDRNGDWVTNSAFEQIRGPQVEFDNDFYKVSVEQNVANLELPLIESMRNTVNDSFMWGFDVGKVRLTNFSWEKAYYGTCSFYYKRTFEFELDGKGHDRKVLDEGTKALRGKWDPTTGAYVLDIVGRNPVGDVPIYPDATNPQHFDRFKDRNGEPTRVILNGAGLPASVLIGTGSGSSFGTSLSGDAGEIEVKYYKLANLFLLGIPTVL